VADVAVAVSAAPIEQLADDALSDDLPFGSVMIRREDGRLDQRTARIAAPVAVVAPRRNILLTPTYAL
jgi:hypothetical protein